MDGNPDQVPAPIRNEAVAQVLEEANLQADNQRPAPERCVVFFCSALAAQLFVLISFLARLVAAIVGCGPSRVSICGCMRRL